MTIVEGLLDSAGEMRARGLPDFADDLVKAADCIQALEVERDRLKEALVSDRGFFLEAQRAVLEFFMQSPGDRDEHDTPKPWPEGMADELRRIAREMAEREKDSRADALYRCEAMNAKQTPEEIADGLARMIQRRYDGSGAYSGWNIEAIENLLSEAIREAEIRGALKAADMVEESGRYSSVRRDIETLTSAGAEVRAHFTKPAQETEDA